MASTLTALLQQLEKCGLDPSIYAPVFSCRIDMVSTAQLHMEAFDEVLEYLYQHVDKYSIVLPNSQEKWIPLDFIKVHLQGGQELQVSLSTIHQGIDKQRFL